MQIAGKKNTFAGYIISHFIVFIIPVILLVLFSYNTLFAKYTEDTLNKNFDLVQSIKDDFESRLYQMEKIVMDMENDHDLNEYKKENSIVARVNTQKRLKSYWVANGNFDEVMYYIRGYDYLISSRTSYPVNLFMQDNYKYASWSQEEFIKDINTLKARKWIAHGYNSSINKGEILTLLYPMPVTPGTHYGCVLFMIDTYSLIGSMKAKLPFKNVDVLILDESNTLLASTAYTAEDYGKWRLDRVGRREDKPFYSFEKAGSRFLLTKTKSQFFGWTFVAVIPMDEVMHSAIHMRNTLMASIVVVMVLGLVIVYLFAKMNYWPIRSLAEFIRDQQISLADDNSAIDAAKHVILNLTEKSRALARRLDDNISSSMEWMLYKLVFGEYVKLEQIQEDANKIGLEIPKSACCIVIVRIYGPDLLPETSMDHVVEGLCEILADRYRTIVTYRVVEASMVMLLEWDGNENGLKEFLNQTSTVLGDKYKLSNLIAIGSVQTDLCQVYKSYEQAMNAIRYIEENGGIEHPYVIFAKDIDALHQDYKQLFEHEIESVVRAINLESVDQLDDGLKVLITQINRTTGKLFHVKLICSDAANAMINAVNERYKGFVEIVTFYYKLNAIRGANKQEEAFSILCSLASEIKDIISSTRVVKDRNLFIDSIIENVGRHYMDYDFSINSLAAGFGISVNSLSQRFKRHTGITPSQYITTLRINKAKELLIRTDFSLKNIIESVGYTDETTLIRNFKEVVGVTPGKYREMSRTKNCI